MPIIIANATFSTKNAKTISYKDLKENQKVYVAGKIHGTQQLVNFLCTVQGNKLVTAKDIYTFIPAEASSKKNSMDMKLKFFRDEDDLITTKENLEEIIPIIQEKIQSGKIVQAYGQVFTHYRLELEDEDNAILTSKLKDIFKEDNEIYIQTRNSIYHLVS